MACPTCSRSLGQTRWRYRRRSLRLWQWRGTGQSHLACRRSRLVFGRTTSQRRGSAWPRANFSASLWWRHRGWTIQLTTWRRIMPGAPDGQRTAARTGSKPTLAAPTSAVWTGSCISTPPMPASWLRGCVRRSRINRCYSRSVTSPNGTTRRRFLRRWHRKSMRW